MTLWKTLISGPNSDVTEDFDDDTPNYLDLDSDDDGCYDVVEAGFCDLDGDGVLGVGDPDVDENGQVLSVEEKYSKLYNLCLSL